MNGLNGIKGMSLAILKGIAFFIAGIIIFSAVFYFFTIDETYIPILRTALIFITAFLTGIFSSKKELSKGWLRGLISGVVLCILFIAGSKLWGGNAVLKSAVTYIIMLALSTLGGIIGINVK